MMRTCVARGSKMGIMLMTIILVMGQMVSCIKPTSPILASPNTESSPSNFILNFQLGNNLPSTGYLMIVIPIYTSTVTPTSCLLLNSSFVATQCLNLDTASSSNPNPLTINSTAVNTINLNIVPTKTVVIQFNSQLTAGVTYSLQILISSILPFINALTTNFEFYSISGTGYMYEQNWNFGNVFIKAKNNNIMNVVSINSLSSNLPGTTTSSLLLQVTIGISCPTPLSRIMFTISGQFYFTVSSLVNTISVTGAAPQILSMSVVSQNIIMVIFNEQFSIGRKFRLTITNILNPLSITTGSISLYSLPYNSITPLEIYQSSIPIATASYTPALTILTAEGLAPFVPMLFYSSTVQYITLTILLPRNFDSTFVLQLSSDAFYIHEGSVYVQTSTVNVNTLKYYLVNSQTVQISGFSTIPSGSLMTVTMRVWITTNPVFNVYVSIDQLSQIGNPIIYGTSSATVSGLPEPFISLLTGNSNEANKFTNMQTSTSSIFFSVTPAFTTYSGSFLQIYSSPNVLASGSFSGSTSCLIGGVAQTCTIVTSIQYTLITIASNSSYNLYPQSTTTTVQIDQLTFRFSSSRSNYLYNFYFQLTVSQASQASTKMFLYSPMVLPQRNQMLGFSNYFSNDLYNSGANFLNMIRVVSSVTTSFQYIVQVNERRIITIFAYQTWTNLFPTLQSGDPYPCFNNLVGSTCTYIRGSTYNSSIDFALGWDRINIVLPGTESTTSFSVSLPNTYPNNVAYHFEVMVGIMNINNGAIKYLQALSAPILGASTYLLPVNVAVYSKPKQTAMQLSIAGNAGSYKSNVSFIVAPSASFAATSYSASLIVMSSWAFFDTTTSLSSTSLSSVNPQFKNVEQTPFCLKISNTSYLTYVPFKTTAVYASTFSIMFNNIKLPYNLDLPYYSVTLNDGSGTIDGYDQFINQNQSIFYSGAISALSISCNDNSIGVANTFCTMQFIPFQDIEVQSTIYVTMYGMYVATASCSLQYTATNVQVPLTSCLSNTNRNILTVTLNNPNRLPALNNYTIIVNGISIDAAAISNYIYFEIRDPTGSYTIEYGTKILATKVAQNFPIYINQIYYTINNPVVSSSLFINFTLPRTMNSDESFALVLSLDFSNLNNVPCRLNINLKQADGITVIPTTWLMKTINNQIIFEGLQQVLLASNYSLEIYGVKTPSVITQDMITIIYLRNYDNTYTQSNIASSTAQFPSLVSKVNSLITFASFFNTEGLEHEMQFTVVNQYVQIDQDTIWIINLPRYYAENIWNQDYLMYCRINAAKLPCTRSLNTPYQIVLSKCPLVLSTGSTYVINVYGIACPKSTYVTGSATYVTESIFFAMMSSSSTTSYTDYSDLFVSEIIVNPQTQVNYGNVIISSVTSSNMQTFQSTFFTITLACSVDISPGYWIVITFPSGFDKFYDISVVIQTQYGAFVEVTSNTTTVNTRISYQISTLTIPAGTPFQILITSLLTPSIDQTMDMNTMNIFIASSTRATTLATSTQETNLLSTMTFVPSSLHLVINNELPIHLTAGTYTQAIQITSSDNNTFLTNMKATFSSNALIFVPNPTYMYLGKSSASFLIGSNQNLVPTTYTFNITKKQTSISSFYTTLSLYPVIVDSIPVSIVLPTSFNVPKGGCSLPILITLTNAPFSQLNLAFQYDTTTITLDNFWVHQQLSFNTLSFSLNATTNWISFCSSATLLNTTFLVNYHLTGDNAGSYALSANSTVINIVSNATTIASPSLFINVTNVQKTYANIQFTTNVQGIVFYELQLTPLSTPIDLVTLKNNIKLGVTILASNNDYLTTQIYDSDRDHRINFLPAVSGSNNYLNLDGLLANRNYTICAYFQNLHRVGTSNICTTFMMQMWGSIIKASITFNQVILANQINNMLCFFVKATNAQISQVVDLEGNSCSLGNSPINYYYDYNGTTITNEASTTIIYLVANQNLTTDPSISSFTSLYNSSGITSLALASAQSSFSINYIKNSQKLAIFNPIDAINIASSTFTPVLSLSLQNYVPLSYQIVVNAISSTLPSTLYLILISYKNISTNQITGHTEISIRPLTTPQSQQIASCLGGSNETPLSCQRIVMQVGSNYSLTFTKLNENTVYMLYYTLANQYPLRPVFYGGVKSSSFNTMNSSWSIYASMLLVTLLLILII